MKQYLVAKMITSLRSQVELIPLPGLYTLGGAQEFVRQALVSDPGTKYVIQEIGAT